MKLEALKWYARRNRVMLLLSLLGLGGSIVGTWLTSDALQSIFASLVAACALSLLQILARYADEEADDSVRQLHDSGVQAPYQHRDEVSYRELIRSANAHVDIVGYTLSSFLSSTADDLLDRLDANDKLQVRIIVADPSTDAAKEQAAAEPTVNAAEHSDTVDRVTAKFEAHAERVTIVTYQGTFLPSMYFRVDREIFVGPYFPTLPSARTPTLRLSTQGWLGQTYLMQLDSMCS